MNKQGTVTSITAFAALVLIILLLSGADSSAQKAGLPNPASAYCAKEGGIVDIRKEPNGGEYGMCLMANDLSCEEWALFRHECLLTPKVIFKPAEGFRERVIQRCAPEGIRQPSHRKNAERQAEAKEDEDELKIEGKLVANKVYEDQLTADRQALTDCFISVMEAEGASKEAVFFTRTYNDQVYAVEVTGLGDLAMISYAAPLYNLINQGIAIAYQSNKLVKLHDRAFLDELTELLTHVKSSVNTAAMTVWPPLEPPLYTVKVDKKTGGKRIMLDYEDRFCQTCKTVNYFRYDFVFDKYGKFIDYEFQKLHYQKEY